MKALALVTRIGLLGVALGGCTSKGPFSEVQVGKPFVLLDSLPSPMRKDAWKTLQWKNLDAKRMTKDGSTCTGHVGVLERDSDNQHWLVMGAVCGATVLTSSSGSKLDGHALKTIGKGDNITLDATFVEALEPDVYALWSTTKIAFEGDRDQVPLVDNTVMRRRDDQLLKLIETGAEGITSNGFEGEGFPREFVLHAPSEEQRLYFEPREQRYAHRSYRTVIPDGGAPTRPDAAAPPARLDGGANAAPPDARAP